VKALASTRGADFGFILVLGGFGAEMGLGRSLLFSVA
jgi:hypothetical protein